MKNIKLLKIALAQKVRSGYSNISNRMKNISLIESLKQYKMVQLF